MEESNLDYTYEDPDDFQPERRRVDVPRAKAMPAVPKIKAVPKKREF